MTAPPELGEHPVAGAYGLAVTGALQASPLLGVVPACAPPLHLRLVAGPAGAVTTQVGPDRARLGLRDGSRYDVDRLAAEAVLTTELDLDADDLAHPYLAPVAALVQQWHGREALHAGAFVVDGEAVLVLASKEGGKSSTLAHLAMEQGVPVLADDLVVLDGDRVLAGPRCLDLRPLTAQAYAARWQGRLVRAGSRTRLHLPSAPYSARLRAVVVLAWGDPAVEAVGGRNALALLARQRMLGPQLGTGVGLLQAATAPVVRLTRRQDIEELPAAVDALLAAVR